MSKSPFNCISENGEDIIQYNHSDIQFKASVFLNQNKEYSLRIADNKLAKEDSIKLQKRMLKWYRFSYLLDKTKSVL